MALLSALAAISAVALQGGTLTLGGKVVQINYPTPAVRQVPDDVKNWDGFGGSPVGQRQWSEPFSAPGDWSEVTAKLSELGPAPKDGPHWKTKIFLLTQSDRAIQRDDGLFYQERQRLNAAQVDSILKALARVPGYARAATNGAVNVSLDVVVDGEPVIADSHPIPKLDRPFVFRNDANEYILPRTNRGAFVAEDKVFRGPYQTVVLLDAISLGNSLSKEGDAYGVEQLVSNSIAKDAVARWVGFNIFHNISNQGGGAGMYVPQLTPELFPPKAWSLIQADSEPTFESLQELYALAGQAQGSSETFVQFPSRPSAFSGNVAVAIANDDQRGSVLRYSENSPVRYGGFALPYQQIDASKTPFLSFWVKSNSKDGMALRIEDGSSKGRFPLTKVIPAATDGAWHQVVIDLRRGTPRTIQEVYLGPPADGEEREQVGDIIYFFDDFQLLAEGTETPPSNAHQLLTKRALDAKALSAKDLEKETSDFVKLNGLLLRETPYDSTDEAALINLSKNVNVRIAGEATKRLAQLGTPTSRAEVLRMVTSSPFEHVRQVAAMEVGKFGDPKLAGLLSRLFASRFWQTRMAGAIAVASIPGDEAAVISMTFLQETDPQIRLALTQKANIQNSVVQKRFLWSAVNDPSDSVRAASAWRLITSGKESLAAEGYKAIRDDSNWVRLYLINAMAGSPSEAHRATLRLAITDLSPTVRAATLNAFAKQPGEVTLEEIANVLQDKFPVVQMALLNLAKEKKLTLPANSREALNSSIDPRVVAKAKELGL